VTTRPVAFAVGLVSAAAEQARRWGGRLPSAPPAAVRLTRSALATGRRRYDELAERGRHVLSRTGNEPGRRTAEPAPPLGSTTALRLPPDVAEEVAERTPGALLDHGDLPLADFDHLTVPQLRSRIRPLDLAALAQLRDYERAHADRLPVITVLENRMTALADAGTPPG
jgi:hypothetical protein